MPKHKCYFLILLQTGDVHVLSVASLTGHAAVAMGPYSISMNVNAPAQRIQIAELLQKSGYVWADPFEVSHVRREDFDLAGSRGKGTDAWQCNVSGVCNALIIQRFHYLLLYMH